MSQLFETENYSLDGFQNFIHLKDMAQSARGRGPQVSVRLQDGRRATLLGGTKAHTLASKISLSLDLGVERPLPSPSAVLWSTPHPMTRHSCSAEHRSNSTELGYSTARDLAAG